MEQIKNYLCGASRSSYFSMDKQTAPIDPDNSLEKFCAASSDTISSIFTMAGDRRQNDYLETVSGLFKKALSSEKKRVVQLAARSYAYAYTNKWDAFTKRFDIAIVELSDNEYRKKFAKKIFNIYEASYLKEGDNQYVLVSHLCKLTN